MNDAVANEILIKISKNEDIFCSNHDIPIIRIVFEELIAKKFIEIEDLKVYNNGYLTYSKPEITFEGIQFLVNKF